LKNTHSNINDVFLNGHRGQCETWRRNSGMGRHALTN
jgi:hypothetical protein